MHKRRRKSLRDIGWSLVMLICVAMAFLASVVAAGQAMVYLVNNGQDGITTGVTGLAVFVVLFIALHGTLRRLFGDRLSRSKWPV